MTNIFNISEGCPRAASSIIPSNFNSKKVADFQEALINKQIIDVNGKAVRKYSKEDIKFIALVTLTKMELTQETLNKLKELMS